MSERGTDGGAAVAPEASGPAIRVGQGFDVHAFSPEPDRPLILGGVRFEGEPGLAGHSDADVIAHAVTDALLGAAGLGDIGQHFPDTDPALRVPTRSACSSGQWRTCGRPDGSRRTSIAPSCSSSPGWHHTAASSRNVSATPRARR